MEITGVVRFHIHNFWGREGFLRELTWASAIPTGMLFPVADLTLADLWYGHYHGHEIKWSPELMLLEILSLLWDAFSRQINSVYCKAILTLVLGERGDKHWWLMDVILTLLGSEALTRCLQEEEGFRGFILVQ